MTGIARATDVSAENLVRLATSGDQLAFADIVQRHHLDVLRVAYVIAGQSDLAEEAAAAAWSIAWRKLHKLRDPERLRSWLVAIAANEARQLLRRQHRSVVVEIPVDLQDDRTSPDPATRVGDLDLLRALRSLAPEDRALIALRYVAGLNSTELSRATGMSASGTRARLARLLEKLRKELADD